MGDGLKRAFAAAAATRGETRICLNCGIPWPARPYSGALRYICRESPHGKHKWPKTEVTGE